jgi:hypothetical protein
MTNHDLFFYTMFFTFTYIVFMILKEVVSLQDQRNFLEVHALINRSDSQWVRPLNQDILQVFDPKKNKTFRHGEVCRWLLLDDSQKPIGRIAAFVNKKYKNKGDEFPVGGIGFFDCINNQQAANRLFDTARQWLEARNMKAMDGPINFGERDRWWGLLVEGFYTPLYGMNYNPPYYRQLFENYGFKIFYNQLCWSIPVAGAQNQLLPKFYEAHDKFSNDPAFSARAIGKQEMEKSISYFCQVYNKAWAKHEGNKEMSIEQARLLFKSLKPVLDEHLVWFAFHGDEPIAMWISIPDINQIIRHLNGRFGWWAKLQFLYYQWRGTCDRFVGIIYGIVPEYQGTGIDYFMIVEAEKVIKAKTRYRQTELLWQGDFNPKMLNISKNLGAQNCRKLITYRYIFDPSTPFKRHPMIS